MRQELRQWSQWQGRRIHPLRLVLELAGASWAIGPLALLLYVFLARLAYPMDLEWMEGGSLYQAYRLLHGLPVYINDPSRFAPYPYPPVHTLILAVIGVFHLDFWSGRLVSIGFFLLTCRVLFTEIYRQNDRSSFGVAAGLMGVAVIVCAYPVLGQWYDLIRVDMTMMGLLVWGAARALKQSPSLRHLLITAVVLSLAVYAKQTAAVFVAWICLYTVVMQPKTGFFLSLLVGGSCITTLFALNWSTNGDFQYLVIANPENHEIKGPVAIEGLEIVLKYVPFIALVPIGMLLVASRGWLRPKTIFWVGCLLIAFPGSLIPFAKIGAYLNALMPVIVFAGPATILLMGDVARQPGFVGAVARWSTLIGFSVFILAHPLEPSKYLPDLQKRRAAKELNEIASSLEGGLVSPYLGFLPAHSGHKNPHWQSMAVWDSIWRNAPMNEIACFKNSKARWVLLHSRDDSAFVGYVRSHGRLARKIPNTARVAMVTGAGILIDELWDMAGVQ
jgi:hypothetical protein